MHLQSCLFFGYLPARAQANGDEQIHFLLDDLGIRTRGHAQNDKRAAAVGRVHVRHARRCNTIGFG